MQLETLVRTNRAKLFYSFLRLKMRSKLQQSRYKCHDEGKPVTKTVKSKKLFSMGDLVERNRNDSRQAYIL